MQEKEPCFPTEGVLVRAVGGRRETEPSHQANNTVITVPARNLSRTRTPAEPGSPSPKTPAHYRGAVRNVLGTFRATGAPGPWPPPAFPVWDTGVPVRSRETDSRHTHKFGTKNYRSHRRDIAATGNVQRTRGCARRHVALHAGPRPPTWRTPAVGPPRPDRPGPAGLGQAGTRAPDQGALREDRETFPFSLPPFVLFSYSSLEGAFTYREGSILRGLHRAGLGSNPQPSGVLQRPQQGLGTPAACLRRRRPLCTPETPADVTGAWQVGLRIAGCHRPPLPGRAAAAVLKYFRAQGDGTRRLEKARETPAAQTGFTGEGGKRPRAGASAGTCPGQRGGRAPRAQGRHVRGAGPGREGAGPGPEKDRTGPRGGDSRGTTLSPGRGGASGPSGPRASRRLLMASPLARRPEGSSAGGRNRQASINTCGRDAAWRVHAGRASGLRGPAPPGAWPWASRPRVRAGRRHIAPAQRRLRRPQARATPGAQVLAVPRSEADSSAGLSAGSALPPRLPTTVLTCSL